MQRRVIPGVFYFAMTLESSGKGSGQPPVEWRRSEVSLNSSARLRPRSVEAARSADSSTAESAAERSCSPNNCRIHFSEGDEGFVVEEDEYWEHVDTLTPLETQAHPEQAAWQDGCLDSSGGRAQSVDALHRRSKMAKLGGLGKKFRKWTPGVRAVDSMVNSMRRTNFGDFHKGLQRGWGVDELAAMRAELPAVTQDMQQAARVLVLRHGMGHHQDLGGALSIFNRDATLNDVGRAQASAVGDELQRTGISESLDMVVVSPFTRTLETAALALGTRARSVKTIVQPLCAEHTLARSTMQQGDRGSSPEELRRAFPVEDFPQYDFSSVADYCASRGLDGGKWWLHNAGERHESHASFAERAHEFRKWLGQECTTSGVQRSLVVSHGGLLLKAFGGPPFQNLECRAYDVWPDGSFQRVVQEAVQEKAQDVAELLCIDGSDVKEGTTYYMVRLRETNPVLRRYTEFAALKSQLKQVGKERFSHLFPSKHGVGRKRQAQLETWLRAVVAVHGIENFCVATFLSPTERDFEMRWPFEEQSHEKGEL